MAYTLSTSVKLTDRRALREHLRFRNVPQVDDIDWALPANKLPKAFSKFWGALEGDVQRALDQDLDRVEQFANEDAQSVLRSVCLRDDDLLSKLERAKDDRARALAILRTAPEAFEKAEAWLESDTLLANRRMWSGFRVVAEEELGWTELKRAALEEQVRQIYSNKSGAYRELQLEVEERDRAQLDGTCLDRLLQVTIYHEGDVNRQPVFEGPQVAIHPTRPALLAVLLFDPSVLTIQVASAGGRDLHRSLAEAFAEKFWQRTPRIIVLEEVSFALQRLKSRQSFPFDRSDGLWSVALVGLVLKPRAGNRLDTSLRVPNVRSPVDLWELAARQYGSNNPLNDPAMEAVSAELRFELEPVSPERRLKAVMVKLSRRNGSNTARLSERHRLIIDRHLHLWGLIDDPADQEAE